MTYTLPRYHITEHDSQKLAAMCFLRTSKARPVENPYRVGDVVSINSESGIGTVCGGLGEYLLVALLRFDETAKAYAHTGETVVKKVGDVRRFELHGSQAEITEHSIATMLGTPRHV